MTWGQSKFQSKHTAGWDKDLHSTSDMGASHNSGTLSIHILARHAWTRLWHLLLLPVLCCSSGETGTSGFNYGVDLKLCKKPYNWCSNYKLNSVPLKSARTISQPSVVMQVANTANCPLRTQLSPEGPHAHGYRVLGPNNSPRLEISTTGHSSSTKIQKTWSVSLKL